MDLHLSIMLLTSTAILFCEIKTWGGGGHYLTSTTKTHTQHSWQKQTKQEEQHHTDSKVEHITIIIFYKFL